jgi:hypothetical protein
VTIQWNKPLTLTLPIRWGEGKAFSVQQFSF